MTRCRHLRVVRRTEADGCSWVACACGWRGPKRHSITLAVTSARLPRGAVVLT